MTITPDAIARSAPVPTRPDAGEEVGGTGAERVASMPGQERAILTTEMTRVEKPWGYELHWAKTERYVGKLIHVNAGHALSLQYHNVKDETIYLHSGKLLFEIEEGGELVKR